MSICLLSSCSENQQNEPTYTAEQKIVTPEPKIVVNAELDSVFAQLIDSARDYFDFGSIEWSSSENFKRDSVGNRMMDVYVRIDDYDMNTSTGSGLIKVSEAMSDFEKIDTVTYRSGKQETFLKKIRKGDILVTSHFLDGRTFIYAHSKKVHEIQKGFNKVLFEMFGGGDVLKLSASIE